MSQSLDLAGGRHGPPSSPVNPLAGPNALQGNAMAALVWVAYDLLLSLDREIVSVWKSPWSVTKCLYLFLRYNSLLALAFYFMETLGTTPFVVMLELPPETAGIGAAPCLRSFKVIIGGRSYIAVTEILCVLVGEALILLRINALYGWERKWVVATVFLFVCEAIVGIVTTVVTLSGGSQGLSGSTRILDCLAGSNDVPDVNIGMWCTSLAVICIYFGMIFRKTQELANENSRSMWQILHASDLLPTIHICLKDACAYFSVGFSNSRPPSGIASSDPNPTSGPPHEPRNDHRESGIRTDWNPVSAFYLFIYFEVPRTQTRVNRWLIATYTISSTRIFLNLKDLSLKASQYNSATWSEFERTSVLDFREIRSGVVVQDV
ncbi:hypothetical protein B0H19DRAFT_1373628 [Mycena capillaripes]|nr:hypothetical protein B0H19DRAFT_1373628 [Mycena capillaripes]